MIDKILDKCENGEQLTDFEIKILLNDKDNAEKIYSTARKIRGKYFGNKVFLYGFVYFSTFCKNECTFCYYRRENKEPPRYRKSLEEIVNTAIELKNSGVHLIDLTMGEDVCYTEEKLCETVKSVKNATGLPIMISPGVVSNSTIESLAREAADWYALYQETHNRGLFSRTRINQSYDDRMNAKLYAKKCGMLIEEGLLTGIGDTEDDRINSFNEMKKMGASQVRTMTFVPQSGTPMENIKQSGFEAELKNIAIMRLIFPNALIPASLDVDGLNGLSARLNAGANVVTSIIPPLKGFAGVAHCDYNIDDGFRTVEGITPTVKKCGLETATVEEYMKIVSLFKQQNSNCTR